MASSEACTVCSRPIEHKGQGAGVRLSLGPGDEHVQLWLPFCTAHLERFVTGRGQEVVECRITRVSWCAGRAV